MNDKDLNALIRMADEVDTLEQAPPLRFQWSKPARPSHENRLRRMSVGIGALAAAACLGFMAMVYLKPAPKVAPVTGPVVIAPADPIVPVKATVTPVLAATSELSSVILAFYRDAQDNFSCVQLSQGSLRGRSICDVKSAELIEEALRDPCHENPDRVLVIAMQGPKDQLPSTAAQAEVLAACVTDGASHCGDDSLCITSSTSPYLGSGVTMVAGSLGFR